MLKITKDATKRRSVPDAPLHQTSASAAEILARQMREMPIDGDLADGHPLRAV